MTRRSLPSTGAPRSILFDLCLCLCSQGLSGVQLDNHSDILSTLSYSIQFIQFIRFVYPMYPLHTKLPLIPLLIQRRPSCGMKFAVPGVEWMLPIREILRSATGPTRTGGSLGIS